MLVHTSHYSRLENRLYIACYPIKTTTYRLHVVPITTHTHDRRKSIGIKKQRKVKKNQNEKKAKNKKERKTRKPRKDKSRRGSKERKKKKMSY